MKLKYLFICLLTGIPFLLTAQIGFKGGVNLSYISGNADIVQQKESKLGFQFAMLYKHHLQDDQYYILSELKYIRKGAKFRVNEFDINAQFDYLELPVLFGFNLLEGAITINAGPEFGILADVKYEFSKDDTIEIMEVTNLNLFNTFDIGLVLGMSVTIDNYFVELRHNIGLIPVDKDLIIDGVRVEPKSRNYNAELSVGHYF